MDNFKANRKELHSPADRHWPITPDSNADLDPMPRVIVPLTDGDVEIIDRYGTAITYTVVAGERIDFRAARIGGATTATVVGWE